jgi:photosystem II P680 reaction center D1 protein
MFTFHFLNNQKELGSLVTSSLIRETTEAVSTNAGYRFGQEEETYNIVAAHGYFGRLIFQYALREAL